MTPQREWKRIQRQLRGIPTEEIGPVVAAEETDGLWCLVAGDLAFVPVDESTCEVRWDDALVYAQFVRYVQARPERVHSSVESAREFVRSQLGKR
jgi:hypothetical protein